MVETGMYIIGSTPLFFFSFFFREALAVWQQFGSVTLRRQGSTAHTKTTTLPPQRSPSAHNWLQFFGGQR